MFMRLASILIVKTKLCIAIQIGFFRFYMDSVKMNEKHSNFFFFEVKMILVKVCELEKSCRACRVHCTGSAYIVFSLPYTPLPRPYYSETCSYLRLSTKISPSLNKQMVQIRFMNLFFFPRELFNATEFPNYPLLAEC